MVKSSLKVGDKVLSRDGTLAYYNGDMSGTVETIDGIIFMVRMDQSGRLVPFHIDQLIESGV